MATPLLLMRQGCTQLSLLVTARHLSSAPSASSRLHTRLLLYLSQHFHDVETFISWGTWFKNRRLRQKNVLFGYTQNNYGDNVAAAYFILSLKGGFRFAGHQEWFQSDRRGKFSWDFMNFPDNPIEEVDVSNSVINYSGLENLVRQRGLRSLSVKGCAEVDDWFLSRLHVYQDTLEKLDISHCPCITVGGLAALQNLRGLRWLDVSSLPRIQNPELVHILLEEMLPHCQVTLTGYSQDQGLPVSQLHTQAQAEVHEAGAECLVQGNKRDSHRQIQA